MASDGLYHGSVLVAVVLAGGESTRMGMPKALLTAPDGQPFVVRIVRAFADAGIGTVAVVTGSAHEAISLALERAALAVPPCVVRNADPSRGQVSSLWAGMDAVIRDDTEGLLVTLVDVPMLTGATVSSVVDAWRASRAPIVRPAVGARHGHPVLFDRALFDELRGAPLEAGAKAVVRRHEARILNVTPPDLGCLRDIDTPEDYRALLQ
jgi:molybdenum cofactor cytidylyltransferase